MKKWLTILIVVTAIGLVAAFYVYKYVYNKPHPEYEMLKPDFTLNAQDLFNQFKTDKAKSQQTYNGKMVQIAGTLNKIEDKDSTSVAIFAFAQGDFGDEGIRCTMLSRFSDELKAVAPGSAINIKGYCSGYNDTDVELIKCSIVK